MRAKPVVSVSEVDVIALVVRVEGAIPRPWVPWPGGWPGEVEAALLDAVLGIRARYGKPHNGVRGAVGRWRAHRGTGPGGLDELQAMASAPPSELERLLTGQRLSGRMKPAVVSDAAQVLCDAGVRHAADAIARPDVARAGWTSVRGLGDVTAVYFMMLLGEPGVKADTWVRRFVSQAVGREVTAAHAEGLMTAAASRLGVQPTDLDHAVWSHVRRRPARRARGTNSASS